MPPHIYLKLMVNKREEGSYFPLAVTYCDPICNIEIVAAAQHLKMCYFNHRNSEENTDELNWIQKFLLVLVMVKKSSLLLLNRSHPAALLLTRMCLTDKVIRAWKKLWFQTNLKHSCCCLAHRAVSEVTLGFSQLEIPVLWIFPTHFAVKSILLTARKHQFHWEFVYRCQVCTSCLCCTRTLVDPHKLAGGANLSVPAPGASNNNVQKRDSNVSLPVSVQVA